MCQVNDQGEFDVWILDSNVFVLIFLFLAKKKSRNRLYKVGDWSCMIMMQIISSSILCLEWNVWVKTSFEGMSLSRQTNKKIEGLMY